MTLFEKQKILGGMLTLGIPSYRLEKEVINAEIDVLREMGVKFETGIEIGKDKTIQNLRETGYHAFYVAIGAHSGRNLGIEGEDAAEVVHGVDFLRNVNLGQASEIKGKVVVIGGGNVAIDVARTATRLKEVTQTDIYCLETRESMPAHIEEINEAIDEEITINNSYGPSKIITENGKVTGVAFKKCLSTFDSEGRFNPQYDEKDVQIVTCDYVLLSVGQTFNYGSLLDGEAVNLTRRNTIEINDITLQTSKEDIFAGGDVASGPKLAIDAIASGKEAAVSIHRFVQHGQSLVYGRDNHSYKVLDKDTLADLQGYDHVKRQKINHVDGKESRKTFSDLRGILTEDQIKLETSRCLSCGASKTDEYLCVGCGACTLKCKFDAIKLVRVHDVKGFEIEALPKAVLKQALTRKVKIVANKINPFTETR